MAAGTDDQLETRRDRLTDALLLCGAVWPPAFLAAVLVEGATRADYDPVRLPLSLLALTDAGWSQTLNFVLAGGLAIMFAAGMWRIVQRLPRTGVALLGLIGLGLVGAGVFPASPGGGYPPAVQPGPGGTDLHDVATLLVFGGLVAAATVFGRWFARSGRGTWALASIITAVLVAGGFVLMATAFSSRNDLSPVGGLIQRITVLIGWTWLTMLALWARGRDASPAVRT
jgi:hypothetical membrane protein